MGNLNEHDILVIASAHYKDLRQLIEAEYGFQIIQSEPARYISFTSRKAILHTSDGDYFLKEKPVYCSDPLTLELSAQFQSYLSKQLPNVPRIKRTKSGSWYVVCKGRQYFLTQYIPGRVYNGTLSDIDHGLVSIFDLHKHARNFITNVPHESVDSDVFKGFLPLVECLVATAGDRRIWEMVTRLIEQLTATYCALNPKVYEMSHGDFSLFNLLFDDGNVIAINDFDNVCFLPRVHDFAEYLVSSTLIHYLGPLTNLQRPVLLAPERQSWNRILKTYVQAGLFSDAEWRLFPCVVKMIWLEILLLAVVKNDYQLDDLKEAITCMQSTDIDHWIEEGKAAKSLYIWDFHDTLETGTLFIITEIANTILKEHGSIIQYEPNELAALPSFSWNTFFQKHFPEKTSEEISRIAETAYDSDRFAHLSKKHSVAREHALEVLDRIQRAGGTNIVISHSRNDRLKTYIEQIGAMPFIKASYGVDDGTVTSKSDVLLKKTQAAKSVIAEGSYDVVYAVGDSESDFNMARAIQAKIFYWISSAEQQVKRRAEFGQFSHQSLKYVEDLCEILDDKQS